MKFIFLLSSSFFMILSIQGDMCCVDSIHRRNDEPTKPWIVTPVQHVPCKCPCTERRFGGTNVCPTCGHSHICETTEVVATRNTQALIDWLEKEANRLAIEEQVENNLQH